jgi:hypothetical protein
MYPKILKEISNVSYTELNTLCLGTYIMKKLIIRFQIYKRYAS